MLRRGLGRVGLHPGALPPHEEGFSKRDRGVAGPATAEQWPMNCLVRSASFLQKLLLHLVPNQIVSSRS